MEKTSDEYGNWTDVKKSMNPVLELEKAVVYNVLSHHGPDVDYTRIGRVLPRIRRKAGDVLKAFETGKLLGIMEDTGFFAQPIRTWLCLD